ncbi:hypothetical protein J1G44_17325 [Cellulomonas sp. zg-ZUI199]|uniref:IrrE N-terminal-like domain-containing protein n=1 Tax=Cellulomonas wangleii TaxID=2816956 RepID=A0ABX8D5L1_9CELL|nr:MULTISPECIES: hypothetical protein [Cellulomonas]MBO0901804.1 hypothetical protein [Cellulomonas sp. zg-ZUI22]MBO0926239.1 hypothetical protein [Cellulomonas wangleii]QVI62745.1 hypothetical protein KG103_02040 [Cellulomonas wangleii]
MLTFDLIRASVHPDGPIEDHGGDGPIPRTGYGDLRVAYLDALDLVEGGVDALAADVAAEDAVQAAVQRDLALDPNGERWSSSFAEPLAFAGGARQVVRQLEICSAAVAESAARTPADIPRFVCGLWPDPVPAARSFAAGDGVVVLVNTGLLAALRIVVQTAASSIRTLTGLPDRWVDGDLPLGYQYGAMSDLLERCRERRDLRAEPIQVSIHTGRADLFRRHAMLSAYCQVIAHELGHWARRRPGPDDTWLDDNPAFQRAARVTRADQWAAPIDEVDEVATSNSENHADAVACEIQTRPPLGPGYPSPSQVIGAMAPWALHSGLWWAEAAHTEDHLGWTHPYPELRLGLTGLRLGQPASELANLRASRPRPVASDPPARGTPADMAMKFQVWCEAMLDIARNREIALERGLEHRTSTLDRFAIELRRGLGELS